MKLRLLATAVAAALVSASASATVSLDIQGDLLSYSIGNTTGILDPAVVFIVVDTTGAGFSNPTAGTFSADQLWGGSTNDYVVWSFAINGTNNSGEAGGFEYLNGSLNLASIPGWAQGDHLEMYWFPTENFGNGGGNATIISSGTTYGTFGWASNMGNSTEWITPSNAGLQSMAFLNPQGQVFGPGNDVATFGTVAAVPEASTFAFIGSISALGYSVYRRRRSA